VGTVAVARRTCGLFWSSDARSPQPRSHWSDFASGWDQSKNKSLRDLSLAEFCRQYETIELWFDTRPNAQLHLIWLLDYFRSHPETAARLKLRLLPGDMIEIRPGGLAKSAAARRCHRTGTRNGKRRMASVSGDDAGSPFRSAW
jgi:hypothetical protein